MKRLSSADGNFVVVLSRRNENIDPAKKEGQIVLALVKAHVGLMTAGKTLAGVFVFVASLQQATRSC